MSRQSCGKRWARSAHQPTSSSNFSLEATSVYDQTTKADTYLALGVRELWLVDPFTETIEVRNPGKVGETLIWEGWRYPREFRAKSHVLEGWEVSVDNLFAGLKEG